MPLAVRWVPATGANCLPMDVIDPLVRRAQRGEERAFGELFARHRADVARIVHRILGSSADLEDVVQEVFIQVFRSLPSFRGESKFSTWLYRLTVNVTRMHVRHMRARPKLVGSPPSDPAALEAASAPNAPDERTETARRLRALHALLGRLSEKKREVLALHDFEGVPAAEIARILDIPVLTVRTRLFYARKELYTALASDPTLAPVVEDLLAELHGRPQRPAREPQRAAIAGDEPEGKERRL